jgi:hypothetical protein
MVLSALGLSVQMLGAKGDGHPPASVLSGRGTLPVGACTFLGILRSLYLVIEVLIYEVVTVDTVFETKYQSGTVHIDSSHSARGTS